MKGAALASGVFEIYACVVDIARCSIVTVSTDTESGNCAEPFREERHGLKTFIRMRAGFSAG